MSAKTLDRCVLVLQRVRERAIAENAEVVFCGDFWDARGVLSVRQVDAVMDEFAEWERAGIQFTIIPGNHDQVSTDGVIHGVRLFEKYKGFRVATDPIVDKDRKVAFLPWREENQSELISELPGTGWVVFAHFEVQGAVSNTQHKAIGRVGLATIESKVRACFCGHYHKRQKLGSRTWYVGNPYEKDFGELGDPKGIAIVDIAEAVPRFVDFNDMPKHHRVALGEKLPNIAPWDIVECQFPRAAISENSEAVKAFLASIPAKDVRSKPVSSETDKPLSEAKHVASLEEAIVAYVAETPGIEGLGADEVVSFGKGLLSEAPESALAPLHPTVTVKKVSAKDFCALRGEVNLNLDKQGLILLRGPIGVGKTALADAISWCLFGVTAPRKAGSSSASLRGDEVIHDDAGSTSVEVTLGTGEADIVVRRVKKRGVGATIEIDGLDIPPGITDTGDIVRRAVGLDYNLWRSCVNLGQGAVGSFVTDADTKRKELLSEALGLEACSAVQDIAKKRLAPLKADLTKLQGEHVGEARVLEVLRQQDFEKQIAFWEEQRTVEQKVAEEEGQRAKMAAVEADKLLAGEQAWLDTKSRLTGQLEGLMKGMTAGADAKKVSDLERALGSIDAEVAIVERDMASAKAEYVSMEAAFQAGSMPCPTCHRPFEPVHGEKHLSELRNEIAGFENSLRSFAGRRLNTEQELHNLRAIANESAKASKAQAAEVQEGLAKCADALIQFAKIRANKEEAERSLARARATWKTKAEAKNPFIAQREDHERKLKTHETRLKTILAKLEDTQRSVAILEYWVEGFGQRGIPVFVLRSVLADLEAYANRYLSELLEGRVYCQLSMDVDKLEINLFELVAGVPHERRYEQLSGGQRRCVELAFAPFALAEVVFARCGVRVPLLIIDELTTHLGQEEKPKICDLLRSLDRDTVMVIDHDLSVQAEFDVVFDLAKNDDGVTVGRAS